MRRATVFLTLLLTLVALALGVRWAFNTSSASPDSSMNCSVKPSCNPAEVEVFRMSSTSNAHAGTPSESAYGHTVCCTGVSGLSTECTGVHDVVLTLSAPDNAHLASDDSYATEVCLSGGDDSTVECTYGATCDADYVCLATISGTTNAHVADCDGVDDYATKVCCLVTPDNCPTVSNPLQTNTDESTVEVRGDACDEDDDGDGYSDDEEAAAGSLPLDADSTPEVCDGIDNDGNEGIDEGFPDANTNGVPDCRDDAYDVDGDGIGNGTDTNDDDNSTPADVFPDSTENSCGTNKDVHCCSGGADNDPYDNNGPTPGVCDGWADIQDIQYYIAAPHSLNRGQYPWPDSEGYWARGDINGPTSAVPDGFVDIQDIQKYIGVPRALNGQCGVDY